MSLKSAKFAGISKVIIMGLFRRIFLLLILLTGIFLASYKLFRNEQGTKEEVMLQLLVGSLNSAHFQPLALNDTFSDHTYKIYLNRLDFNKKFLLKEDVDKLNAYRYKIDEEVSGSNFEFFDLSYKLINNRIKESEAYSKETLEQPFDFTADESIQLDGEKLSFARTKDELKEAWRLAMKYQTLTRLSEMMDSQEKAKERKDTIIEEKSFREMEEEAREKVRKNNADFFRRLNLVNRNDRFFIYLNSIANIYDPHTEFFPPREKKNFDISMTGQLEGIGAQLQEREGQIRVASIVPGSASWKQGQLKTGDIIMKVGQGSDDPVNIEGMRIDEAVELIRGKKGTEVRLTVRKPDGTILVIPIIRDIVVLEETFARSAVLNEKKKIGYIKLPTFYGDLYNQGTRSSAADVKNELYKLKAENVDGIILDLRDNGGGSLHDVVKMVGYFIATGPVVQVKTREAPRSLLGDDDESVVYDGPLAIMVNGNSASASEILAAAIQDHKRGVVVGSVSTFGKGTVQRFVNLDEFLLRNFDSYKPLGEVKLTIQKFYRISGGTTQLKGVVPDIVLPDIFAYIESGEKALEYPLPWDNITPVEYASAKQAPDIERLKKKSDERAQASQAFKLAREQGEYLKKETQDTRSTLNLEKFRAEQKENRERIKKYEDISPDVKGLEISNPVADRVLIDKDSTRVARNKEWFKAIRKDIYLYETMQIVEDIKK